MSAPGYDSYRESGVEWPDRVPSHWTVKPLKRVFSVVTERTPHRSWALGLENIEGWSGRLLETETEFEGEGVAFEASDILYGKLRPYLAKVHVAERPGEAVGDFHVLRAHQADVVSRYIAYQLLTREMVSQLNGSTFGARMPRVGWDFMGSVAFAFPPPAEQAAIAAFLDRETGKIDALVEAQTRLIELLKEKRQAVISHAVTKGLDPAAPMKDSGVEWLGQVPAHWEVRPFKYALERIESGTSVNAVDVPAGPDELGVLKTSCVYSGSFAQDENKTVVAEEIGRVSCPVRGGTLIVSRMNTPDLVGAAGLVEADVDNLYLPDRLWQLHFSGAAPAFAHYWTLAKVYRGQVQVACAGTSSSMQNLSQDQLRSFAFPFPPPSEQLAIVDRLNKATSATDRLVTEAENAITLLQERRAALISAAVTGKIDVRRLAPQQAEAA